MQAKSLFFFGNHENICRMDVRRRFRENLKRLLEGKRQEDVAARTIPYDEDGRGCTQQDISDYLKWKRIPRLNHVEWLAAALDVDITDLLADPEAHPEEPDVSVRVVQRRIAELAKKDQELFLHFANVVKNFQPR